jgi:hypothetical protein
VGNFSLNRRNNDYVNTGIFQAQQFNLYFCQVHLLVVSLVSIMTHPPWPHTECTHWAGKQTQKLGLVWRNRKKISQIINDYLCLPFFLLIILWYHLSPFTFKWKCQGICTAVRCANLLTTSCKETVMSALFIYLSRFAGGYYKIHGETWKICRASNCWMNPNWRILKTNVKWSSIM